MHPFLVVTTCHLVLPNPPTVAGLVVIIVAAGGCIQPLQSGMNRMYVVKNMREGSIHLTTILYSVWVGSVVEGIIVGTVRRNVCVCEGV